MMGKAITPDEALARLEALCARSEQCSSEVLQKMRRWGIGASDRERILERLVDRRFVDDARYARAYVRSKFLFNKWGRRKIMTGLAAKGVERVLAEDAMSGEIDEDAYRRMLDGLLAARARGMARPLDYDSKVKLGRFAMQRGFEWELIKKSLAHVGSEEVE